MKKIGLVDKGKYKAFYDSHGKVMWKLYEKEYEWKYIIIMLFIFWPISLYYACNKDRYMVKMTGNVNWAGAMKYIYVFAVWFLSIFMTCLWIWIICIIFNIK